MISKKELSGMFKYIKFLEGKVKRLQRKLKKFEKDD